MECVDGCREFGLVPALETVSLLEMSGTELPIMDATCSIEILASPLTLVTLPMCHTVPEFSGFAITKKAAPKAPATSALASKLASKAASAPKPTEDKHEMLRRTTEAAQITLQKEDIQKMNEALEADPTTFDYDDFYEDMQPKLLTKKKPVTGNARYGYGITIAEKSTSNGSSSAAPQSLYIDSLLSKARDREMERELVLERQRHKENQKYEEMHGATESFVTPEYQAKLDEDQRKREELDRKEAREQSGSSSSNFYANLSRQTFGDPSDASHGLESQLKSSSRDGSDSKAYREDYRDSRRNEDSNGRERSEYDNFDKSDDKSASVGATPSSAAIPKPKTSLIAENTRKPRRHTDEMIEEAKRQYQQRQALRAQLSS